MMKDKTLLCAFGTLKSGFHNHGLIERSQQIGIGLTNKKYLMTTVDKCPLEVINKNGIMIQSFKKEDLLKTPFPYVLESVHQYFIEIELYLISQRTLKLCDRFESVPYLYFRKGIEVIVNEKLYQAQMYFYNEQFLF